MAKTAQIIECINDTIKASLKDKRFAGSCFHGLAITHEENNSRYATTYSIEGEGKQINPDDEHPITIYHKNNGSVTTIATEEFGDGRNRFVKKTSVSMIVIGIRKKLRMTAEDLETAIECSIPGTLSKTMLQSLTLMGVDIQVVQATYNSGEIYKREFNKENKNVDPRLLLVEIRYNIECMFNKTCINTICS